MKSNLTREEAMKLLKTYNQEPFHIQHALTVEGVMRWYANDLGYGEDAEYWAMVGLSTGCSTPCCGARSSVTITGEQP